ncbi:MAG: hypothetical protein RQ966_02340, partial [Acetobacteraceae bacterium]|nr:hypothetical protein [Acetobacteraceae bacterium]
ALAVVYSPTGPGAARIDPATLQSFERRHRAGILRRLCQRRQSPAVHLRLVTALFELWAHSRGDRIIFGLFARAVLTSGRRILSHA